MTEPIDRLNRISIFCSDLKCFFPLKTLLVLRIMGYEKSSMQKNRLSPKRNRKVSELKADFIMHPSLVRAADSALLHKLRALLSEDLGFHDAPVNNGRHNFHSFPAKFPPELSRLFIENLTTAGELVLDPMAGSGTTVVEAVSTGRNGLGFDIDPLALLIAKVKITPLDASRVRTEVQRVVQEAELSLLHSSRIERELARKFDEKTRAFINYWFTEATQLELMSLLIQIEKIEDPDIKDFLKLTFSAIIVTKSGGVSLAWDLGHTRPHRLNQGKEKKYKPAIPEFEKRAAKNLSSLLKEKTVAHESRVRFGSAESLPLDPDCVDLIVTSPPYASNAIDYMRAHKFSLVWLGMEVDKLTKLRSEYIGNDKITGYTFESLPSLPEKIISTISALDSKKGTVLRRYFSEMTRVLREMHRVLKPGRLAIVVVGSSVMRGIDTETDHCLAEIGASLDMPCAGIGVRMLDRDRRMMPTSLNNRYNSQIENRMHREFVLAFVKPR